MSNQYRIIGPPGTGKTTRLVAWIGDAVEKYGRDHVMVVSFTKAAATEIASRGIDVEPENVGTLHSICYRAIARQGAIKIAESQVEEQGGWNYLHPEYMMTKHGSRSATEDPFAVGAATGSSPGSQMLSKANLMRAKLEPQSQWPKKVLEFYEKWHEWKIDTGYFDFTDLIEFSRDEFDCAPGEPSVIFADETQDLNPLQLSLLARWGASAEFFVTAGDADQTLFTFAGCMPEAFLSPELDPKNERVLEQSYRVPKAAHVAAMSVVNRCENRRQISYLPTEVEGVYAHARMNINAGRSVCEEVINKLAGPKVASGSGEKRPCTVMVLANCAFQLNSVVSSLRKAGVPFHNPFRVTAGNWNPLRGGGERLRDFLVPALHDRMWTWGELHRWAEHVSAKSGVLAKGAKSLIKHEKQRAYRGGGMLAPMTTMECRRVLTPDGLETAREAILSGRGADWLISHCTHKGRSLFQYAKAVVDRCDVDGLTNTPRVIVGTIHSVKGGESDHVYICPDMSTSGAIEWFGGDKNPTLRAAYVALTRARHSVSIFKPATDKFLTYPDPANVMDAARLPF